MIRGITSDEVPYFVLKEYDDPMNAREFIPELLQEVEGLGNK
jgi:hypothetical protein